LIVAGAVKNRLPLWISTIRADGRSGYLPQLGARHPRSVDRVVDSVYLDLVVVFMFMVLLFGHTTLLVPQFIC
jgi:hypothetical protein